MPGYVIILWCDYYYVCSEAFAILYYYTLSLYKRKYCRPQRIAQDAEFYTETVKVSAKIETEPEGIL